MRPPAVAAPGVIAVVPPVAPVPVAETPVAAVPVDVAAAGLAVVDPVKGVSATPRGSGLSLREKRGVCWSCAAGLGAPFAVPVGVVIAVLTVLGLLISPFTAADPVAVGRAPPFRRMLICCAVGAAMPLAIPAWRAISSVCAICA